MQKIIAALALILFAFGAPPAAADQKDPRLDKLFTQLKGATTIEVAQPIEAQIWEIWMQSGDQNVDALMAIGTAALNDQDYSQAYRAFGRVVQLAPGFAEGWNKRATALYLLGRFDDSIKDIASMTRSRTSTRPSRSSPAILVRCRALGSAMPSLTRRRKRSTLSKRPCPSIRTCRGSAKMPRT